MYPAVADLPLDATSVGRWMLVCAPVHLPSGCEGGLTPTLTNVHDPHDHLPLLVVALHRHFPCDVELLRRLIS